MSESAAVVPYEEWFNAHSEFFKDYQFPEFLSKLLYQKLVEEIFDVGSFFSIDTSADPTLIYTPQDGAKMLPGSNVFVTDHCWAAKPGEIYQAWKDTPQLRERLEDFLSYSKQQEELTVDQILERCDGFRLELDNLDISSIKEFGIPEKYPNLEILSIIGNPINDVSEFLGCISQLTNLKGLWMGSTPIAEVEGIRDSVLSLCPKLELFNSKFTSNWGKWALLFTANSRDPRTVCFLDLSGRGIKEIKEEAFKEFKNLARLDIRDNDVNVAGIKEIIPSLGSLFCDKPEQAPEGIVFINGTDKVENEVTLNIPERIWDHLQAVGEYWCLGDEIALSIHPTFNPNFAQMPVRSPLSGQSYFVFWPVEEIQPMDEVKAILFPLIPYGIEAELELQRKLKPVKLLKSAFVSSVTKKRPVKFYCDLDIFRENLHSDKFQLVESEEEADLCWYAFKWIKDFKPFYEAKKYLNQIENENYITNKDLLYETCTGYMGDVPWLPETYILTEPEEITRFVKRHEQLVETNQSHAWVVKAYNYSRANLMVATENSSEVLRHASAGPRLAQRYIWNPLNIYGLKFDLRFIVLLKSVKPMELFCYKVFWPRFAPKKWALDDFSDYERHFTVMNYRSPEKVTHKNYLDFIQQFGIENKDITWDEMLKRCYESIRDLFICGCQEMVATPYTKAMFGIDLMITNEYQPVILECNYQPDCHRACNLCPSFLDDVLEVLFIEQPVTNDKVNKIPLE